MNKNPMSIVLAVILLLAIAGCTAKTAVTGRVVSHPPLISVPDPQLFGAPPIMPEEEEIFYLSSAQKEHFLEYFNAPNFAELPDYKKLYNYLEQSTHDFNYRGKTHIAADALAHEEGNCLSLAILTTALARVAGVKVGYQLIDSSPVFSTGETSIIKGVHIRTKLYRVNKIPSDDRRYLTYVKDGIIVDYFPHGPRRFLSNVTSDGFVARYYRNLAVDYLQAEDFRNSYWYTQRSLEYAPSDPEGINLLAVIYKRAGHVDKAEEIYRHGIGISDTKLSLLKNYRQLLLESGREGEAEVLSAEIHQLDDPSPYNWLSLADSAYAEGEFSDAEGFYNRAIELAPYLQYGYLGLAKIYFVKGDMGRSEAMLLAAQERNYDPDSKPLYEAKLAALAVIKNR